MKKINYIYANLPAYRKDFFAGLSEELFEQNIQLEVLHGTLIDKKKVKQDHDNLYNKKSFKSDVFKVGSLRFIRILGLFNYLKNNKPDAIVISYMPTNITMLRIILFCISQKIPYATWRCGYNRPDYSSTSAKLRGLLIDFVEKRASLNVTYGTFYKNKLIKKGIPEEKIKIAQNTINVEKILTENEGFQKHFTYPTKILFVGALIKGKLLKSSIDAIKMLIDENYDVHFDIIGGGEIINELKSYTKKLNLEKHISIPGPKYGKDVKKFFRNADVFLLAGTGGLAINEAMAYGLPVISTSADGTGVDFIKGNGYLLEDFGNAELQYKYLKKFINLPVKVKEEMSEKSKIIIKTKASLKSMVKKHSEACLSLLH